MLNSGDIQTALNSIYPFYLANRQNGMLHYDDNGDGFIVNYDISEQSNNAAFIIHGWWGSASSSIVQRYASILKKNGYSIICINLKDHCNDYSISKSLFSFGDINYIYNYIETMKGKYKKIILLSFSFGANIALRLKNVNVFDRIILISPVFDIASAFQSIEKKMIYRKILLSKWKSYLKTKQSIYFKQYDLTNSLRGKSIYEIINGFISYIGCDTVEQYYVQNSITDVHINNVKRSTLLIHSQNDPIIQLSNIYSENEALKANKSICLCVHEDGGHCPYLGKDIFAWLNSHK